MIDIKQIKICIFIHYSKLETLPYYTQIYIEELSQHFDKVKVLTNNSKILTQKNSFNSKVSFEIRENKGYDFGMFYRYITKENLQQYSELALVNDSNILLNKLDKVFNWGRENKADFWGIINSSEKPWFSTHTNNYHIQSHFIVFNNKAIQKLPAFFQSIDVELIMKEKNTKQLRRLVIDKWEIGLTQYFIQQGLRSGSFIDNRTIADNFLSENKNVTHTNFHKLAQHGYPLLKKKLILEKKKLFKKKSKWPDTINEFGNKDWDMNRIIFDLQQNYPKN